MNRLQVDNKDIAKYIGQTPRNINTTYEIPPKKANHYLCLQIGTLLHLKGIDVGNFLRFVESYDALYSAELDSLRKTEAKYNKIVGIANE